MQKSFFLPLIAISFLITSCASESEINMAQKVITALPDEVKDCTFLGNVDTNARATINNARFDLKLQSAKLGATHLVETFAYTAQLGMGYDFGVALSGRAYKCPIGKGPLVENEKAKVPFEYKIPPLNEPEL